MYVCTGPFFLKEVDVGRDGTWYTASFRFCEIASYYFVVAIIINIVGLKIPYSGKIWRIGFQWVLAKFKFGDLNSRRACNNLYWCVFNLVCF